MDIKEFFQKGRDINIEIKVLQKAVEEAYALATGVSADYSSEKVQTSKTNSSEQRFIAYIDYSEKLKKRIAELIAYRTRMLDVMNKIDNGTYRALLTSRYISCNAWECVAEEIGYSEVWTRTTLHSKALKEAEKYYLE